MSDEKNHDYHLVDPSPWPILTAFGVFAMAATFIFFMHDMGSGLFPIIALVIVCILSYFWWADITDEGETQGHHTPVVQIHFRYGMFMFLMSEVMFFVAWFWAYFDAALFPNELIQELRVEYTGGQWPPLSVRTFDPWDLPFINTLVLLLSGFAVTWAHHALIHNDRKTVIAGLSSAVVLGVLFTILQAVEYSHAAFGIADGLYPSTFYLATGFHGFHVIIGTIFLFVILIRTIKGHFKPDHHFGFEAAAWYWHFVDVIWIFLFIFIYVLGAGDPATMPAAH
ncbi:MAG: cytochrome c oxidase subunit 3 [OCS116 cluster bacterium]|uniref:Cytochrome c oxidase subunit 3 n=1 Tax=OCS116 cluster bacterium TaxID=2030921 RepID=A0A2A4Z943_9PROT|nr:cytochrome c oxidase subunit 3 [OCS116 cluster bacterium]